MRRALFFHLEAFGGIDRELQEVAQLLDLCGSLESPERVEVPFGESRSRREKAIHRLVILGVIADYTVQYRKSMFEVLLTGADNAAIRASFTTYVASYQRGRAAAASRKLDPIMNTRSRKSFIIKALQQLVEFVYDVVEKGRRVALGEVLRLCAPDATDDSVRRGIIEYLGASQFTPLLEQMRDADDAGLRNVAGVLELVRSSIDASEARSQISRMLESYPDHPGLLLTRAAAEALLSSPSLSQVFEDAKAATIMAQTRYSVKQEILWESLAQPASFVQLTRPEMADAIIAGCLAGSSDTRSDAIRALRTLPEGLHGPAVAVLLHGIAAECRLAGGVSR